MGNSLKKRYLMRFLNVLEHQGIEPTGWYYRRRSFSDTKLVFNDHRNVSVVVSLEELLVQQFGKNKDVLADKREQCIRLYQEYGFKTRRLQNVN